MSCYVCENPHMQPVYTSIGKSITTLCKSHPSPTRVFFCTQCHHVQTEEIPDLEAYYAHDYNILIKSEDEDQIYTVEGNTTIFRFEHQAKTLRQKVPLTAGQKVLDYGCAKSSTWRILKTSQPDIDLHLFDVSENYTPFWENITPNTSKWAIFSLPEHWRNQFELVTSFYAFEHFSQIQSAMQQIHNMLKPEGLIYILVPNFLVNRADFIVVDHVNHFTEDSLQYLFESTGFEWVEVDTKSHYGGLIAIGKKSQMPLKSPQLSPNADLVKHIASIAKYWQTLDTRLVDFEAKHRGKVAAIYGSGFYGSYIASSLKHLDNITCFLDQNPHRQGEQLLDKPILAPEQIPDNVEVVYVGLNPEISRQAIAAMPLWQHKEVEFCFL